MSLIGQMVILGWSLPLFPLTAAEEPQRLSVEAFDDMLVLDIPTTINLALSSDKLFDAQAGVRTAQLSWDLSLAAFDLNITPKGDTGYIGGGTAGTGLTLGGGVTFDKKLPTGTQITVNPSILKAAKKVHSIFQMRVSQPIFKGFDREYNLSGVRRAEFAYRSATRMFYKNTAATMLRAIELLHEVAKQEAVVKLHQESYQRFEKFWVATTIKERIGLSDALDVYRADMELKQTEDALNQSIELLRDAEDSLRDQLSLPPNAKFKVAVALDLSPDEWRLAEAIEIALQHRIEIDQGLDQLNESRRLAQRAKSDLLPDLNLVVDYSNMGYGEELTGAFGRKRESRWGIGLTTSADINRAAEKSAFETALIAVESAEKLNADIRKNITLEVKRALRAYYRAREKISLQRLQTRNSEAGLKLAKAKFARELATNFDVIQAEKAFHAAQIVLQSAMIDQSVGEYRLKAAMGLLINKP